MSTRGDRLPPRLHVRLLGAVEIIFDGRRLRAFDAPRLQRFLALVVLRSDVQHRARLAFELWPDSNEGQARTNLRKLLHEIRHALPDAELFVEIDTDVVRWLPDGPSRVDVLEFGEALAAGDLEVATRVYGGDLLPACYDDWVLEERERLRADARGALARLAAQAAARSDHQAAISSTRRMIELEPTDEWAVRAQMESHVALGDRTAALRAFHRYAERLERDLGVAPGPAVEALYQELRERLPAPDQQPPTPVGEIPFVGRRSELEQLVRAWESAVQGGAHLVLVSGEPGIGKSRLAEELSRRVRAGGHPVVTARAYEAAGRPPWGPIVDLFRSDELRSALDMLQPAWRREIARLLPELQEDPEDGSRAAAEPAERYRLFDAVSRALTVDDRPRLVIVDDLQWCDPATIETIGFVIRSAPTAPLLVIGTVRTEEVPGDHALLDLIDVMERDGTVSTVSLAPLDEAATVTLAGRLNEAIADDPELAKRLWSETEGNPLFIVERTRAGMSASETDPEMTPTMRAVLRSRLGHVSALALQVAQLAAVIGRSFSMDLLEAASGLAESDLVDPVDELWHRRIVRDQGVSYDFSHDRLRAATLETVPPAQRRMLHRAVAEALADMHHHDPESAASQLAAHYDQARMVEQAIEAYRTAAARATRVSALDEAVAMFRRARSLIDGLPPSPNRDRQALEICIALGSPLVALEGYGSAHAHQLYEEARALCQRLQRPVEPPILRGLGLARLQGCRFEESRRLGQALVDHEGEDPAARTEGHYLLGVTAFWSGELATARHHLTTAIEGYDRSRRPGHLASYAQDAEAVCLVRQAWVDLWAGDPGKADATARSALELAAGIDHAMTSWYVVTYASIIAAESEDLIRLEQLLDEAERLRRRVPVPYLMIVVDALGGWLAVEQGSAGAVEEIVRSVERSRVAGESLHLTYTLLLLARARASTGEIDHGRAASQDGLAWSHRHDQRYLEAELLRVDGELAHRAGATDAAYASIGAAVALAGAQGASWLELRALHSMAAHFPDEEVRDHLAEVVEMLPSGHELRPVLAAAQLLRESD